MLFFCDHKFCKDPYNLTLNILECVRACVCFFLCKLTNVYPSAYPLFGCMFNLLSFGQKYCLTKIYLLEVIVVVNITIIIGNCMNSFGSLDGLRAGNFFYEQRPANRVAFSLYVAFVLMYSNVNLYTMYFIF